MSIVDLSFARVLCGPGVAVGRALCFLASWGLASAAITDTPRDEVNPSDSGLRLVIGPTQVEFVAANGVVAGRYNYADPFKPYLHPLQSPNGHCVSLASPHDHVHHKGLMYALRIPELNFWEERSTRPGEAVGRERHLAFSAVRESGDEVGFTETLSWEPADGGEAVFDETRTLACRREASGFRWTWTTTLTARRRTRLIHSQWSHVAPDRRKTNYHGLGLRLRREFGGGTRNNALQLDHGPLRWNHGPLRFDFETAMGTTPARVTFIGAVDGIWPTPRVAVTFAQAQKNGLFVMVEPFAFFALGPSNLGERPLSAGEVLHESYTVTVADVDLVPPSQP